MQLKTTTPSDNQTLSEVFSQMLTNDTVNQTVDDTAILDTGIRRGNVVKYSSASGKWVLCNGTVKLNSTDTVGIVEYANGTSGQVRTSGVYLDANLTSTLPYYCQANGTLGTTVTKVFMGRIASTGRFMMVSGSGGSVQPATSESLGGIIVGYGLDVDSDGLLSTNSKIPSWANYRGDGSDGDFVAVGGETLSGIKQYKSFIIGAGLTVNVGTDPLVILCKGDVVINGVLNGKGGNGGTSTSSNTAAGGSSVGGSGAGAYAMSDEVGTPGNGTGGGSGGYGKRSGITSNGGASYFDTLLQVAAANGNTPSAAYQALMTQIFYPFKAGAGGGGGTIGSFASGIGGAGGGGGGTIILAAETVSKSGTLNVAGGAASTTTGSSDNGNAGGGAGGAAIIIIAKSITIAGTITVAGGAGGLCKTSNAQNGGAGWYKIFTAGD